MHTLIDKFTDRVRDVKKTKCRHYMAREVLLLKNGPWKRVGKRTIAEMFAASEGAEQ